MWGWSEAFYGVMVDVLVLGGTAFLGRAVAGAGVDRSHLVTCLARGSGRTADGARLVISDRDQAGGLASVVSREWDVVIDVSRQPGQVRRAVADLRVAHWVFVSSSNVYADFSRLEQDETARIRPALVGDVMPDMTAYGEAKVACEVAVRSRAGSATIVRSGLIGGPGDWSGRSGYWPWRFAHPTGDDVLVPDDPDFPVALIDVRDLAAWIVTAAENRLDGTFNVTGDTTGLRDVLETAARAAESPVPPRPVATAELARHGVGSWMGPTTMPLWIEDPAWRGFATLDTDKARAAGLVTRSLDQTFTDTLTYEHERTEPRQAGLTDDEERRLRSELQDTPT